MACCCSLFGLDEACHYVTTFWSTDHTTSAPHHRRHKRPASTYKRVSMIQEVPDVMDTLNKWFGHNQHHTHHDDHYFQPFVIHRGSHLVTTFKASNVKK